MATRSGNATWWTADDDAGATFPPGFVSEFMGFDDYDPAHLVIEVTYRDSRKPRIVRGRIVGNGNDLLVQPVRRGKIAADHLRGALHAWGGDTDMMVRPRSSGRARGVRVRRPAPRLNEAVEQIAAARLLAMLTGRVLSVRDACRVVDEADPLSPDSRYTAEQLAMRHVESLQRQVTRWRARARDTNPTTNAEPNRPQRPEQVRCSRGRSLR